MNQQVAGLFLDSKSAGEAISALKEKGYTKDISVITKDYGDDQVKSQDIKKDVSDAAGHGAVTGATMGAAVGVLSALLAGVVSFVVPAMGLIIFGPLAAGLAGAATGAVTGGVVGALVDAGFPEEKAKMYEHQIQQGETLVSVSTTEDRVETVESVFDVCGATQIETLNERA